MRQEQKKSQTNGAEDVAAIDNGALILPGLFRSVQMPLRVRRCEAEAII